MAPEGSSDGNQPGFYVPTPGAPKTGLFIVLDGTDGCGKGTQARMLVQKLKEVDVSKRYHPLWTHEPARSDHGLDIRRILKEEQDPFAKGKKLADLFIADRSDHWHCLMKPVLEYGGIVVCDRFKYSTLCYQTTQLLHDLAHGAGAASFGQLSPAQRSTFENERDRLFQTLADKHRDLPLPDISFIVDVPVAIGLERVHADKDRKHKEMFETVDFQTPLREMYLSLPQRLPDERIISVDGTESKDAVAANIWRYVEPLLEKVR